MQQIFTNSLGTFVFDGKVVDKMLFSSPAEALKSLLLIEKGEVLSAEKELQKKHPNAKIDRILTEEILAAFKPEANDFFLANLLLTKRKLREGVNDDMLIIQSINAVEELNKVSNLMAKRLREWYELYNPEFSKSLANHEAFVKLILTKSKHELLKEIKVDEELAMGADLKESDLKAILDLALQLKEIYTIREKETKYLETLMKKACPNVYALCGELIGAKLLALAGSLDRLSKFPASTVQLLGAEKALFRHIRTKSRCPKYGILIQHPLVTKAQKSDKGRVARALADKISIAAKIDFFKGEFAGDKLKKALESKFGEW